MLVRLCCVTLTQVIFAQVFVQVNTSGEEQKSGENAEGAVTLCQYIKTKCASLQVSN